ncbi:hypothetical protein [Streptomyces sp. NPDC088554]|uniref:hypothetical protein n=1 Tax=Streptomyces sp. NPDC088554 TaxID=3365865 RepID=UPI0037FDA4C7
MPQPPTRRGLLRLAVATSGRCVREVRALADCRPAEGPLTRTERDRVVTAALGADLRP